MEQKVLVNEKDILAIKEELVLIKTLLLNKQGMSLEEEMNQWQILSDKALEDFEDSL